MILLAHYVWPKSSPHISHVSAILLNFQSAFLSNQLHVSYSQNKLAPENFPLSKLRARDLRDVSRGSSKNLRQKQSCISACIPHESAQIFEIVFRAMDRFQNFIINSTHDPPTRGTNTYPGKWGVYRNRGKNIPTLLSPCHTHAAASSRRISYRSAAPANWFLSSPRKEGRKEGGGQIRSLLGEGCTEREAGTWRKNPPNVTPARHPVFQSGIDKKSLPVSRRGNNYARNITVRARRALLA